MLIESIFLKQSRHTKERKRTEWNMLGRKTNLNGFEQFHEDSQYFGDTGRTSVPAIANGRERRKKEGNEKMNRAIIGEKGALERETCGLQRSSSSLSMISTSKIAKEADAK